MSLLMWECGLKQKLIHQQSTHLWVTPYVGVWIETDRFQAKATIATSLLMWECGLKQFAGGEADHPVGGHSLCGSVD